MSRKYILYGDDKQATRSDENKIRLKRERERAKMFENNQDTESMRQNLMKKKRQPIPNQMNGTEKTKWPCIRWNNFSAPLPIGISICCVVFIVTKQFQFDF